LPPVFSILSGALLTLLAAYGLGRAWFRNTDALHTIVLAIGAALLSLVVFLLLVAGVAGKPAFAAVAAVSLSLLFLARNGRRPEPMEFSRPLWILVPFGFLYLVHAMAPEIQPDAVGYHLGNVVEYLRLGRFPDRVDFYEIIPHGAEMLFTFAFAFGGHSAAKLIHFAFLAASVPLILLVGKRLGLERPVSALAAVFYVVTPVVGTAGTCAYVDAALAFFALATAYLVLRWREEGATLLLISAGLAAGFCYGVKITGLTVAAGVAVWLLARGKWKDAALFGASAAAMIAPWMIRAFAMTGNPVAPLMNRFFPNPYFHILSEQTLASRMRLYGGETWPERIMDLAFHGQSSLGLLGPLWLLAPLALLALRRPAGRVLLCAGALLAAPWWLNTSARFLIPALPFFALAMLMSLPRRLGWALVAGHAVLSWPAVAGLYADTYAWRLHGLPVRAALRIEPERDYLRRTMDEYKMAEAIQQVTPPSARILDLFGAAPAYADRELSLFYQSAKTEAYTDSLRSGLYQHLQPLHDLSASWPDAQFTALRFRQEASGAPNWSIVDVRFYHGDYGLRPSARWTLDAWPNAWEAPLALDNNLTTYWAAREAAKPGMFLEVRFDRPQWLTGAAVAGFRIEQKVRVVFYGQGVDGAWRLLSGQPTTKVRQDADLRHQATRALKRGGFTHILAPAGPSGNGLLGRDLLEKSTAWGVELAARVGSICLFRIL
jgi:4-amino-4-deoxy-L-arabinose transferase-like glycosyltransferase